MKTSIILLLTLGLAIADPISKQIVSADNNHAHSSKCSESESKHNEETTANKGDSEQKKQVLHPTRSDDVEMQIPNVEVIVEEDIDLPSDIYSQTDNEVFFDNDETLTDEFADDIMEKHPDELMETAAGFAPLPFIRKRQKSKKRFATRRHFKRNPYPYYYSSFRRSPYFFYPYYAYYRPSSLRYY
ncbi:uncharacterized protein LOC114362383 [Ostrinia furnacalis]|uniref:uncharacterized protein LOC114362383 n=1 Tax=Ostrinia furnacalis TaxID=93504 RepID=UPI001040923B|nr:uncharacterized protein LOC114362383 [Ostrinia furnacalis]